MIPGLDHDGDPVLYVELHFELVEPGVDPTVLIQAGPAVRQADLRRAVSTAYYALFHGLAETAADRLVGATPPARRYLAWSRVYRDLNHTSAKKACVRAEQFSFITLALGMMRS